MVKATTYVLVDRVINGSVACVARVRPGDWAKAGLVCRPPERPPPVALEVGYAAVRVLELKHPGHAFTLEAVEVSLPQ